MGWPKAKFLTRRSKTHSLSWQSFLVQFFSYLFSTRTADSRARPCACPNQSRDTHNASYTCRNTKRQTDRATSNTACRSTKCAAGNRAGELSSFCKLDLFASRPGIVIANLLYCQ